MATFVLVFHTLCTLILLCAFIFALIRPSGTRTLYFQLLMIATAFYTVGYLFEITATTYGGAIVARRIALIGSPFLGPVFFLFIRTYFERRMRNRKLLIPLFAIPGIAALLGVTWPTSKLYYISLGWALTTGLPELSALHGPFYYVSMAYTIVTYLMGIGIIVSELVNPRRTGRRNAFVVLAASLIPAVAQLIYLLGFSSANLFPSLFSLSCVLFQYMTIRYRMADWTKYGRDRVVEYINDGYVLIDHNNRFLDCNTPAMEFFPALKTLDQGKIISEVENFPVPEGDAEQTTTEFEITVEGEAKYLRASSSPIFYSKQLVCTCIMLYDITETYLLMQELNTLATRDYLTDLLNRGTFFNMAEHDFLLAKRNGQPAALLMVDIDYFKSVNDRYGHVVGDEVLRTLALQIKGSLRKTDLVGRYGGEEICIFLPYTDREGALLVAESLRRTAAKFIYQKGERHFNVTISTGLACLVPEKHESLEQLLSDADDALYFAKTSGRNCVKCADELECPVPKGTE